VDAESVYRQLREQIVSGVYRAGDRLPETSLGAALAVSRTPVREALRRLESDGLVHGSGRGVTVTAMSTPELRHAHAVRGALEALTAELAADRQRAGRLAPAALADLETQAGQLEQVTAAGDLEQAADLNRRFHLGIAELAGNPIAVQILDRLWNQLTVSARASLAPSERPDAVAAEHHELLAAITRGDRDRAGRIAGHHATATATATASASAADAAPSSTQGA
jgi:DNA-binding GntR family transcriptional regulator